MKKILISILPAVMLLGSCTETAETMVESSVELSDTAISAAPEGGDYPITVTSSEDWMVSGKCDWVELSARDGKSGENITFIVAPNNDGIAKETSFKIFAGSAVKEISVVSNPSYYFNLVSDNHIHVPTKGGETIVRFETNIPLSNIKYGLSDENADWLNLTKSQIAFGKALYTFEATDNSGYKSRDMTLSFTVEGMEPTDITVSQAQLDALFFKEEPENLEGDLGERQLTFTVLSNVEYASNMEDYDWIEVMSEKRGKMQEDGLTPVEYTVKLGKSVFSRSADLKFSYGGKTFQSLKISQVNPDAVFAEIKDETLRQALADMEWIHADGELCEVLEEGMNATSLVIDGSYSDIREISGLGAFHKLQSLHISDLDCESIDIEDCTNISDLRIERCHYIYEINLGDNPVTELALGSTANGISPEDAWLDGNVEISGTKLEKLEMSFEGDTEGEYYDYCYKLYVSACPALKYLSASRISYWGGEPDGWISNIYLSDSQMEAYENGNLEIVKYSDTRVRIR